MSDKNNELLRIWTDDYFNRNLTELEKRLSDWWLSEGFFYVSNFTETDNGTRAELMLLIGNSVNNLIFENNQSPAGNILADKKENGWKLIEFDRTHYIPQNTPDNRKLIEQLLYENIRHFEIIKYNTEILRGEKVLKSVVIEIKKRESNYEKNI